MINQLDRASCPSATRSTHFRKNALALPVLKTPLYTHNAKGFVDVSCLHIDRAMHQFQTIRRRAGQWRSRASLSAL